MNITDMNGGSFTINGLQIEMRGTNIYVNGRLYGPIEGGAESAPPTFDSGDRVLTLDRDGAVIGDIHGSLEVHGTGNVIIEGNVGGSVTCGGDLTCERVGGSANAGRDVRAGKVGGSTNAGRDVVRG